jgi:hypothetical protein
MTTFVSKHGVVHATAGHVRGLRTNAGHYYCYVAPALAICCLQPLTADRTLQPRRTHCTLTAHARVVLAPLSLASDMPRNTTANERQWCTYDSSALLRYFRCTQHSLAPCLARNAQHALGRRPGSTWCASTRSGADLFTRERQQVWGDPCERWCKWLARRLHLKGSVACTGVCP